MGCLIQSFILHIIFVGLLDTHRCFKLSERSPTHMPIALYMLQTQLTLDLTIHHIFQLALCVHGLQLSFQAGCGSIDDHSRNYCISVQSFLNWLYNESILMGIPTSIFTSFRSWCLDVKISSMSIALGWLGILNSDSNSCINQKLWHVTKTMNKEEPNNFIIHHPSIDVVPLFVPNSFLAQLHILVKDRKNDQPIFITIECPNMDTNPTNYMTPPKHYTGITCTLGNVVSLSSPK